MMRGASPLLSEPPLRRVSSFLEAPSSPSVSVRLAEPFWSGMAHLRLLVRAVQLHTLLELSEAPTEPPTTPPTSKLFEQANAFMKVGHARRLDHMTALLAAAVRARRA